MQSTVFGLDSQVWGATRVAQSLLPCKVQHSRCSWHDATTLCGALHASRIMLHAPNWSGCQGCQGAFVCWAINGTRPVTHLRLVCVCMWCVGTSICAARASPDMYVRSACNMCVLHVVPNDTHTHTQNSARQPASNFQQQFQATRATPQHVCGYTWSKLKAAETNPNERQCQASPAAQTSTSSSHAERHRPTQPLPTCREELPSLTSVRRYTLARVKHKTASKGRHKERSCVCVHRRSPEASTPSNHSRALPSGMPSTTPATQTEPHTSSRIGFNCPEARPGSVCVCVDAKMGHSTA